MDLKEKIITHICYTPLVYGRVNKKLHLQLSNTAIEHLVLTTIQALPASAITKVGKNYYIANAINNIRLTVNAHNYRLITADILSKLKP